LLVAGKSQFMLLDRPFSLRQRGIFLFCAWFLRAERKNQAQKELWHNLIALCQASERQLNYRMQHNSALFNIDVASLPLSRNDRIA